MTYVTGHDAWKPLSDLGDRDIHREVMMESIKKKGVGDERGCTYV